MSECVLVKSNDVQKVNQLETNVANINSKLNRWATVDVPKFGSATSQTITVQGMTANDHPIASIIITSNVAKYYDIWSHIYRITSGNNSVTFYSDAATTDKCTVGIKW